MAILSSARKVPPQLSRAVYRSCLRASKNGRFPEVFGSFGVKVFNSQVQHGKEHPSLAMPRNELHVRQRLKSWFQSPIMEDQQDMSPLGFLPHLYQQEAVLFPTFDTQDDGKMTPVHILSYSDIGAFTGEKVQFKLSEQAHVDLVNAVLSSPSKQFLLRRSNSKKRATLFEVVSQAVTENHEIYIACLAGPRVSLLAEDSLEPEDGAQSSLQVATRYEILKDFSSDNAENMHTRQYILDMLHHILPNQDTDFLTTLAHFGLPPLEPEAFSFWALRYVLPVDDVASRWKWAHDCRNTTQRLNFVMDEIESILEDQDERKQTASGY